MEGLEDYGWGHECVTAAFIVFKDCYIAHLG